MLRMSRQFRLGFPAHGDSDTQRRQINRNINHRNRLGSHARLSEPLPRTSKINSRSAQSTYSHATSARVAAAAEQVAAVLHG